MVVSKEAPHVKHIINFYREIAEEYEIEDGFLTLRLRRAIVKLADVKKGDTVLDICTGGGDSAACFARVGAKVIGIDLSPDMLKMARSKYPKISFRIMDASKLDFSDNSFDIVSVQLGLHDMPVSIIKKTLKEMRRVSRRTVIIAEPRPPKNRFLKVIYRYILFDEFFEAFDWKGYTNLDLREEILKAGLRIEDEISTHLWLVRVYKCVKN